MAALHNLEIKAAVELNAYTMAPNNKRIRTVLSPDLAEWMYASKTYFCWEPQHISWHKALVHATT